MNNTVIAYQPSAFTGLIGRRQGVGLLRDGEERTVSDSRELDAQVHSGDYFVMLATMLDMLSRNIETYSARARLEDIVSDLIYLQDNYTITKNKPTETRK